MGLYSFMVLWLMFEGVNGNCFRKLSAFISVVMHEKYRTLIPVLKNDLLPKILEMISMN
jgi:hypothetical protein